MQYSRVMSVQRQIPSLTLAIGLELAVANDFSNQLQTDFTVLQGMPRFSRLVYGLAVTGVVVVATLLVIVALAGGAVRVKMETEK